MYVIGFTEALTSTFPSLADSTFAIATIVNIATFACVYIGAGWTIKVQYVILAVLAAALASFYVGAADTFSMSVLQANLLPHSQQARTSFRCSRFSSRQSRASWRVPICRAI